MAVVVKNDPVPCKWYVSIDNPECGAKSVEEVHVKTRLVDVMVPLCTHHLARFRDSMMKARHQAKSTVRRG
jgi:hypothetical protein